MSKINLELKDLKFYTITPFIGQTVCLLFLTSEGWGLLDYMFRFVFVCL